MSFKKGDQVKTRRKLAFKGETPKTLPKGSLGTVTKPGIERSNVEFDDDEGEMRRVDNEDLALA